MFTGIVAGRAKVVELVSQPGLVSIRLQLPQGMTEGLEIGASVAVEGVCLTVTELRPEATAFDVMQATLEITTLHKLVVGSEVNVERSAKEGAEIGGHILSGHVDTTAEIVGITLPENNKVITFQLAPQFMRYVFAKGFIAIDGASLTVAAVDKQRNTFDVWLIPETRRVTTLEGKGIGDRVNIEIERATQVTVDTIYRFLEERLGHVLPQLEALLIDDLSGKPALPGKSGQ
ncbi:riboflavin synthase subunit alpha [Chitinimonas sp.]|uniref:riboflavin synthase subunit alpha n=1 Tax=Chitinimonas sp. TaxID=1934313 RepID=UPI002F941DE4